MEEKGSLHCLGRDATSWFFSLLSVSENIQEQMDNILTRYQIIYIELFGCITCSIITAPQDNAPENHYKFLLCSLFTLFTSLSVSFSVCLLLSSGDDMIANSVAITTARDIDTT